MRHRKAGKKLGRDCAHRRALYRNLVTSLFKHEEISTTHSKAKAIRPIAERMVTLAKRGDLHARRQALSYIMDKSVAHNLFDRMKDRFMDRQGGYIRILKLGRRPGDNAPVAVVQLLSAEEGKTSGKAGKKDKKSTFKPKKELGKKSGDKKETENTEDINSRADKA